MHRTARSLAFVCRRSQTLNGPRPATDLHSAHPAARNPVQQQVRYLPPPYPQVIELARAHALQFSRLPPVAALTPEARVKAQALAKGQGLVKQDTYPF